MSTVPQGNGRSPASLIPILRHERRTWAVGGINLLAMGLEVGGGLALNSAALQAEGFHMGAHVAALLMTGIGYRLAAAAFARGDAHAAAWIKNAAAILNALILTAIAGLLLVESLQRISSPAPIPFLPAIGLAAFGLVIDVASLALLHHPQACEHEHHHDLSFRALYLHMVGDFGVGVLSMLGLCLVTSLRWRWADGAAGVCGSVLLVILAAQVVWGLKARRLKHAASRGRILDNRACVAVETE